jgi:hypothetical protein
MASLRQAGERCTAGGDLGEVSGREGTVLGRIASVEAADQSEKELRDHALERLKKRRDFKTHIVIYLLVNAFLVAIWAVTTAPGLFWPIFPILG